MRSLLRASTAGLLGCFLLSGCGLTRSDPKGIEDQFALTVPLHSTPAQVLDDLDRQKLAHSKYHHDETFGNVIEAQVSVKSKHALVDPSYDVFFLFDDQGHLVKYNASFLGYIGL
jgi:hypothetical protein